MSYYVYQLADSRDASVASHRAGYRAVYQGLDLIKLAHDMALSVREKVGAEYCDSAGKA